MPIRAWLCRFWKWSWLITLPVTILFLDWGWATYERYVAFGVRYDSRPWQVSLLAVGKMEFQHRIQAVKVALISPSLSANSPLPTIDLFLNEADERKLNSDLPHSGREYVPCRILHSNGNLYNAKVKYRGDFVQHWGYFKKSIRVNGKKKRLFDGMESFNLIAPKFEGNLNNYLSYKLAQSIGLVAPRADMVNLRINGKNRGIHLLVEQLEELTLRRNNRMPGDLYAGELVGRDSYRGINNHVFDFPRLWEKIAVNNHYPEDSLKPLETLLQLVGSEQTKGIQTQLEQLLNLEMWGRFAAFELLTQSVHYDEVHNWRLYYDPSKGQFEPVIWDPVGWHPDWRPRRNERAQLDLIPSKLHAVLHQNYQFLLARHQAIRNFFQSGSDLKFLNEVDTAIDKMTAAVATDPYMVFNFQVCTPNEARKALQELKASMLSIFDEVKAAYLGKQGSVRYAVSDRNSSVQLTIEGRRPLTGLSLNFDQYLKSAIPVTIAYWVDGKKLERDISGAVSLSGASLQIDTGLLPRFSFAHKGGNPLFATYLESQPAFYELALAGLPVGNRLQSLYVERSGQVLEKAERVAEIGRTDFHNAFSVVTPQPLTLPEVWAGEIHLGGQHYIAGDLVIMPGTTVSLGENAALVVTGRLLAEGTSDQPIRFVPAQKDQEPWGAIVLKGRKASGARFKHCEFSGGSGLSTELITYSAMLSIHDVKDVVVAACHFRDSKIVDDMVHAVYSEVTFVDCFFERAFSDALDLDISQGVIERCRFVRSGNDAIDLMTTEALVKDTFFEGNGDKGISVGEGSRLFALNNQMVKNAIGVQSKDGSLAILYNVTLEQNRKALDAYKKNWRYGRGGTIHLYKSKVIANDTTFAADKKSLIWVYDSYVKGDVPESKRIEMHLTVDELSEETARVENFWRHPSDGARREVFNAFWSLGNPKRRGAAHIAY